MKPPSGDFGPGAFREDKPVSDSPEGTVADVGNAVQRKINAAGDAQDQIVDFIKENPITAALIALGIGYVLAKII
jgi:hypothetical protein